jgi:hypothetical protein
MSEKQASASTKTPKTKILKWFLYSLIVIFLELLAISGAVFINESKNLSQTQDIADIQNSIEKHSLRIASLEELPLNIRQLSSDFQENKGNLMLFQQNLENLKEEVGNKKIEIISQQLANISRRMETVEENKSNEALILSIALLIKENALYGRNFAYEVNILEEMASTQDLLKEDILTLKDLSSHPILSDDILTQQIILIADDFNFEKPSQNQITTEEKSVVSKGLKKIKNTVANMNFDKVVVMKKNTNTPEQKELLSTLLDLIKTHQFVNASRLIENNPQFKDAENKEFDNWFINLKNKISFDEAISKIISSELNILRETLVNKTISLDNDTPTTEKD